VFMHVRSLNVAILLHIQEVSVPILARMSAILNKEFRSVLKSHVIPGMLSKIGFLPHPFLFSIFKSCINCNKRAECFIRSLFSLS
jgi:hypothetical protein